MPPPPRAHAKLPTLTVDAAPAAVKERPPRPRPAPLPPSNAAALAALRAGDKKPLADPSRKESQDKVGNGAVAAGLARSPGADPKFAVLKKDVAQKKRTVAKSHPPANKEATSAQAASVPPKDDEVAQGKTANAEKMNEAKPKDFDKAAFIKAVEKAIAEKAPKNLEEADEFSDSGKPAEVKAEVAGQVGEGKNDSAEQIADTTAAPPDTSAAEVKQVVPMTADRPPGTPGTPDPAKATPDKLPPSATDLSAGPAAVDKQLADNQVTEKQMSTDPAFSPALKDKKAAEQHSSATPPELRKNESQQLRQTTAQAKHFGASAMGAIAGQRVRTGKQVGGGKESTKADDQDKRTRVTAILQKVFDTMKTDVEGILKGLDKLVDDQFTKGEKEARDAFTAEHRRKMDEYKDRRYSGGWGLVKWGHDKLFGLPEEANQIFVEARDHYVKAMREVIAGVADTIGRELTRAKQRIATGRAELQKTVDSLPKDLKALGKEAAAGFADQFDELTQSVDDKSTELVDTLATKYTDAVKAVDAEIEAEKEKNKGLVDKALDAVKGVIKTILELKDMLLGVLAKAAQAVMGILRDPIGFLGNLVSAVGGGLKLFMRNAGRHLQQGVLSWLLGTAATAGITLPTSFDAVGILLMITSLLGLTWANLRARLARKLPKEAMTAIEAGEHALPIVLEVRKRGVRALWDDLRDRVGDLKKTLIDNLVSYLLPTIIMAGITWIISLFNPASAFIRACKMIIDIIKFIVTNGRQIIEFVNTVLDAVIAIAKGGAGGVAGLVEKALARSIPVLIGALAALLGIGGIAGKVKEIFQKLARPVNKAIDWVIGKIVGLAKKVWAKVKALAKKLKDKLKAGGKKVKDKFGKKPKDKKSGDDGKDLKPDWKVVTFSADRHPHRLWFAVSGSRATLMVASDEQSVLRYLDHVVADEKTDPKVKGKAQAARQLAEDAGDRANEIAKLAVHVSDKEEDAAKKKLTQKQQELSGKQRQLADALKEVFEEKNPIEPWLGKRVDGVPKDLFGYGVRTDSGKFLYGEDYSFLQIQRASGFGSADERSFPMVHVDPAELVQKGAGILRADMEVIKVYRATIATYREKLKRDEAPDLAGSPDSLANSLENGANKQRPFNMGVRKQMEAIVNFLKNGGELTGVEVKVGQKRIDYTARMRIDGRSQRVMIEYKHVTGNLSSGRRAELVTKLDAQLTGQIRGGHGAYTAHIISWPEFGSLDQRSQTAFRGVIEDAKELGRTMGINVIWNG
jgi:putative sterol carrier protein